MLSIFFKVARQGIADSAAVSAWTREYGEAAPSYPRRLPHLSGCGWGPPNALQQAPELLMKKDNLSSQLLSCL